MIFEMKLQVYSTDVSLGSEICSISGSRGHNLAVKMRLRLWSQLTSIENWRA